MGVRFSPDARWAGVAAWTPQNPLGDQRSDPAASLLELVYPAPTVTAGVPTIYVLIASVILLGLGIMSGVTRTRSKDRPQDPPA